MEVGGQGKHVNESDASKTITGGYNGGGVAWRNTPDLHGVATGGGATHIAKKAGLLSSLSSSQSDILIVAGGGGYYGGTGCRNWSGSGGSSYIGNALLTNKEMYCYDCLESTNTETKTVKTNNVSATATPKTAKQGNGYAKITLISCTN